MSCLMLCHGYTLWRRPLANPSNGPTKLPSSPNVCLPVMLEARSYLEVEYTHNSITVSVSLFPWISAPLVVWPSTPTKPASLSPLCLFVCVNVCGCGPGPSKTVTSSIPLLFLLDLHTCGSSSNQLAVFKLRFLIHSSSDCLLFSHVSLSLGGLIAFSTQRLSCVAAII